VAESNFAGDFSEAVFWDKVNSHARVAGTSVIERALKLYYSASDVDTPAWAKARIRAALGYFISPGHAVSDTSPVIGYARDLGVLVVTTAAVAAYLKAEHHAMAREALRLWFD
jgi:uncharacterized membrane protein YkvA (DUF1232 family)